MAQMYVHGSIQPRVYTEALNFLRKQRKAYESEVKLHPRVANGLYSAYCKCRSTLAPLLNNYWVSSFIVCDGGDINRLVHGLDPLDIDGILAHIEDSSQMWVNLDDRKLLDVIREYMDSRGYKNLPPFKT